MSKTVRTFADVQDFFNQGDVENIPLELSGLQLDSRLIQAGDIFLAIQGLHHHGLSFLSSAVQNGAALVIADKPIHDSPIPALVVSDLKSRIGEFSSWFYGYPSRSMTMLGITGTNGKTTIAHLIQYLWNSLGLASGTIGTLGVAFNGKNERFEYPGVRTTPEAPELQAVFKKMLDSHVQKVVMEVSSHALSLGRVSGIKFDYALFTNLSQDHLDFHSNMEDYFCAKSMLFDSSISKTGIVCIDDKWGQRLVSESKIPVLTVGKSDADFTYSLSNGIFELSWKEGTVSLVSPLLGDFNATNTAMAMAAMLLQGFDSDQIAAALANFPGVPGRMEKVSKSGQPLVLVDYAHTPDAVERILMTGKTLGKKVIAVLGCGGERDSTKRVLMGKALEQGSDLAIATSDNPRSEDPEDILDQMCGVDFVGRRISDRATAIEFAIDAASVEDVVLILGKGHEVGQEIKGVIHPFDDREIARSILKRKWGNNDPIE